MNVSEKAKERFCKDCNIPIHLFKEPYFSNRMDLYDKFYNTKEKYDIFLNELQKYSNEQEYFEEYNRVKDDAINFIKNSEGYKKFNEEDMNKYRVIYAKDLPGKDIFKPSFDGRKFLSIDMKKANFSALYYYDPSMFGMADSWVEFISQFTSNIHIIGSKYIRQVILGNCNPKRHITFEKYIMDGLFFTLSSYLPIDKVVFFSNDEIVYDVTDIYYNTTILEELQKVWYSRHIPVSIEVFTLHKIHATDGYCKEIYNKNGEVSIEFKCLNNYMLPFAIRYVLGQEVTEEDKMFYHEGLLSKFIDVPKIHIDF